MAQLLSINFRIGTANISDDLTIIGNANLNTVNTTDLTITGALQIGSENVS